MGGCPEGQECLQTGFLGSDYSCQDPPDCSASSCLANERCVHKSNTACVVPVCDPVCSADKKCILDEEGNPNCEERPPPNCNDGCESPNECKWIPLTSTCKDLNCGENGPCTDDQVCFRGVCLETPNCNGHCDDATQKCVYKKKRSWLVPRPICQNLPWYRHGCEENKVRFQRQCLDIPTCDNSCDANTQECQYYLNSIGGLGQKCRTIPKCGEGCAIHQKCEFKRTECSE